MKHLCVEMQILAQAERKATLLNALGMERIKHKSSLDETWSSKQYTVNASQLSLATFV